MTPAQKTMNTLIFSSIENELSELMETIVYQIGKLDPEVTGQDSEINQLEIINKHLDDAHSELLKYIREY